MMLNYTGAKLKQVINCFKEDNPVINKKLKEVTVEEGMSIATELFQILNKRGDGIGLAANQVGIDANVAVVNVREPIILINPEIVKKEDEVDYYEGCLSYPGKGIHTKRYETIEVKTAQVEGSLIFTGVETGETGTGSWEDKEKTKDDRDLRMLEAVCVQHEIDHLNGLTILDRRVDTTYRAEKKIGRNQKVLISMGKDSKIIKYKKAMPLLKSGWTLVEVQ